MHGVRHGVDHSSYLVPVAGVTLLFLGDTYTLIDKVNEHVDVMFVTVGGLEASPTNALKLAAEIRPDVVVPMHWEVLFRTDGTARRFASLLAELLPGIQCFIPEIDKRFLVSKDNSATRVGE